jgi:hypothetical protein
MSQPSPDARAVVRALDALTTQARRLADRLADGSRQDSNALAPPVTDTDDAPTGVRPDSTSPLAGRIEVREPCPYCGDHQMVSRRLLREHVARLHPEVRTAPAVGEDAQRTARRRSLRVLLNRVNNGSALTADEAQLLARHVATEICDANDAAKERARADQVEELLSVAHETSNRSEAERARAVQRAERAETELRVLRAGLRANGADPTQIQNLWAQIRFRNRQWREAKQERDQAQAALARVRRLATDAARTTDAGIDDHAIGQYEMAAAVFAALDGTEQPPTKALRSSDAPDSKTGH